MNPQDPSLILLFIDKAGNFVDWEPCNLVECGTPCDEEGGDFDYAGFRLDYPDGTSNEYFE